MNALITKPQPTIHLPEPNAKRPNWFLFFLVIGSILAIVAQFKGVDFLEEDAEGNVRITETRKKKLQKELDDLENAEQYVLLVEKPGHYPCYNCTGKNKIYLQIGEVWKYGATTQKEKGRYKNSLLGSGLVYVVQFTGTYQECLQQEKLKIYYYAELPENLIRDVPLIRPPGNKVDR